MSLGRNDKTNLSRTLCVRDKQDPVIHVATGTSGVSKDH